LEQEAQSAEEGARTLEHLHLLEEYKRWCTKQAEEIVSTRFGGDRLSSKLKEISSQLRKNSVVANALDRMTVQARRGELIRHLNKEILGELNLPSIDEWQNMNLQGDLF